MKLLNFGSLNIDYTYHMDQFVRPGETKASLARSVGCGGKGLNQSVAAAKAGLVTYHAGMIGPEGAFLCEKLQEAGVNTRFIRQIGEGTGHAVIQVDQAGQNCIILYPGANHCLTIDYVREVLSHFTQGDMVLVQNETNLVREILTAAHEMRLATALNAAPMTEGVKQFPLELLDYLLVNEVEGMFLSGEREYGAIAEKLSARYPHTGIVLTLGAMGSIYRKGGESCSVRANKVKAVDTTAAGDTFTGYFLRGVCTGLTPEEAMKLATSASAIAITRPGAADSVPLYEEVIQMK